MKYGSKERISGVERARWLVYAFHAGGLLQSLALRVPSPPTPPALLSAQTKTVRERDGEREGGEEGRRERKERRKKEEKGKK